MKAHLFEGTVWDNIPPMTRRPPAPGYPVVRRSAWVFIATLLLACSPVSRAESLLSGVGSGSLVFSNFANFGYAFTVGENPLVVTALGFSANNGDVFPLVSLWTANGGLIASASWSTPSGFPAGDFVGLPLLQSIRLEPGQSYVLAIRPQGQLGGPYLTTNQMNAVFSPAAAFNGGLESPIDGSLGPTMPTQATNRVWSAVTMFFTAMPALPPGGGLLNISARSRVGTGDDVSIAGFIISGTANKRVIVRGVGPSLANFHVNGTLGNPTLQLVDASGQVVMSNDDWRDTQEDEIRAAGFALGDPREAAIVADLAPGSYTVILSGVGGTSGVGLIEAYDLAPETSATARPINLSARARVQLDDNVLIGGIILRGTNPRRILVRAVGPDLAAAGVSGPLADPVLSIYDANGTRIGGNDDWRSDQAAEIASTGLAPSDDRDAVVIMTLAPGRIHGNRLRKIGRPGRGGAGGLRFGRVTAPSIPTRPQIPNCSGGRTLKGYGDRNRPLPP